MIQVARRLVLLLSVIGLVTACGSAGSPAPTSAPSTPAGAPVTASPTASPTAAPTALPLVTPYPAKLAPVTGTFNATLCCPMTLTVTASDPRVSGTGSFDLQYKENDERTMAWEWGNIGLSNDGGSWDGTCRGAGWDSGARAEVSCWLTGQGAYDGLTYFQHLSANERPTPDQGLLYGLILPIPAPTP